MSDEEIAVVSEEITARACVVHPGDLRAFKLRPGATNRLAPIVIPGQVGGQLSVMLEIFDVGGRQGENSHPDSAEIFYFIEGQGRAHSDGDVIAVSAGDVVVLPAGSQHWIENTGTSKLYALTTLVHDDGSHDAAGREAHELDASDVTALTAPRL